MTSRPDTYITGVLEGTGIEVGLLVSKLFGNWRWEFNEVDDAIWEKAQDIIGKRIKELHRNGKIRYGSW